MLPSKKKGRQYHRHVCTCHTYDCISGHYVDANGISCRGVELTPEAYEAHQRSELRSRAQAANSSRQSSSNLRPQTIFASQDRLVSCFEQVVLGPSSSSRLSGSVSPAISNRQQSIQQASISSDSPLENLAQSVQGKAIPISSNSVQQLDDSVGDIEAAFGQFLEDDVQLYSCGMYHSFWAIVVMVA